MPFFLAGVLLFRQQSKGCWEPADAMVAVLVNGDVSLRKLVDCSDGVGIPLALAFLGAFYRKVCWGGCPCPFVLVPLSVPA